MGDQKYLVRDLGNGNVYMHYEGWWALSEALIYAAGCARDNKTSMSIETVDTDGDTADLLVVCHPDAYAHE
jgi:hypothetical protein